MQSVFSAALRHEISTESSGMRFRGGALKTDWAKPWHGGAGYGDRIAPALLSGAFELAGAGGSVAPAAMMECVPGCRCAGGGSRRVRDVLAVGWAAGSSGGLVAASGPSEALRGLAGVMKCRRWVGLVWRA